jgi:cell division inhibitor SepF
MISPLTFNDAQEIGDRVKSGSSVFLDMRAVDRELDERLRDFCAGLSAGIEGSVTDVAQGIILIAPAGVSVSRGSSDDLGGRRDAYHDAMDADVTPLFRSMTA